MNNSKFSITFYGKGWPEEDIKQSPNFHETKPTKFMTTRVLGTNPGYGATCISVILAARTILTEVDQIPGK